MMAKVEEQSAEQPRLWALLLPILVSAVLGVVALRGLSGVYTVTGVLIETDTLWGPWARQTMAVFGTHLLMLVGGVGGVIWLKPWKAITAVAAAQGEGGDPAPLNAAMMSVLLGFLALMGLSAAAGVVGAVLFDPRIQHPVNWLTWAHLAVFSLIGGGSAWGLVRLKPWARRGPVSPAARKTNTLFGLSGAIATVACLPLIVRTMREGDPAALFSSDPLPLWIAIFSIPVWLLSWALGWWWYFSADEHEQRASDVGLLMAGGLFATVAPVWWLAARAGLMPPPDAMILWGIVNLVWGAGWFWRRNR